MTLCVMSLSVSEENIWGLVLAHGEHICKLNQKEQSPCSQSGWAQSSMKPMVLHLLVKIPEEYGRCGQTFTCFAKNLRRFHNHSLHLHPRPPIQIAEHSSGLASVTFIPFKTPSGFLFNVILPLKKYLVETVSTQDSFPQALHSL